MATVYLALGSNVGDTRAHIGQATKQLRALLIDLQTAPLYLSKAVGYTDQADFINTAVRGTTDLGPTALLAAVKTIEQRVGRTPTFHNGPREIDIDIIFYDDLQLVTDTLIIPHPEFAQRDFVLRPLQDLNPDLIDPVSYKTISVLLNNLADKQRSIYTPPESL
jgi:2-amino-4-hydroxy-6-hydroxymethyldihydropteridine diphosphokinase